MQKLNSIINDIVTSAQEEQQKIASDKLSTITAPPIISTDLGKLLVKTAELLKEAKVEVTYEDVQNLLERTRG